MQDLEQTTETATRAAAEPLHPRTRIDGETNTTHIIRMALLGAAFTGEFPHLRSAVRRVSVDSADSLVPREGEILRTDCDETGCCMELLVRGPAWMARIKVLRGSVRFDVASASRERTEWVLTELLSACPDPPEDETVLFTFYYGTRDAPTTVGRRLIAPRWRTVRPNYPKDVCQRLDRVMALQRPDAAGGLLLWHGRPGTGKTHAVRALARAWAPWCVPIYITDPENFLDQGPYLTAVLLDEPPNAKDGQPQWKLLILEDTDEYLRSDARKRAGASLGRLLNLTDGLLGQGQNILILVTTNEDVSGLHPAIARPGRCLSSIEFRRFDRREASAWISDRGGSSVTTPMTIADMYAKVGDIDASGAKATSSEEPGMYL